MVVDIPLVANICTIASFVLMIVIYLWPNASDLWKRIRPRIAYVLRAIFLISLGLSLGFIMSGRLIRNTNLGQTQPQQIILSSNARVFSFDDRTANGWKPLQWDTGWNLFTKTSDLDVVESNFSLGNHSGPFLKYSLHLTADGNGSYRGRSGIYLPTDDAKIIGIMADVYYLSDPGYGDKTVMSGFVVDDQVTFNEDFAKKLEPNKWNTLIWSLYAPVFWGDTTISEEWEGFQGLFGNAKENMWPGRRLDETAISRIGIQFFVLAQSNPEEFNGTVYIDNIVVIYRSP